jgi:hypothetical protein
LSQCFLASLRMEKIVVHLPYTLPDT